MSLLLKLPIDDNEDDGDDDDDDDDEFAKMMTKTERLPVTAKLTTTCTKTTR